MTDFHDAFVDQLYLLHRLGKLPDDQVLQYAQRVPFERLPGFWQRLRQLLTADVQKGVISETEFQRMQSVYESLQQQDRPATEADGISHPEDSS